MATKTQKNKKRLVLLDVHAILHRAYHALPDFSSGGEPTGALYGLSTMVLKIIADLNPDYLVACYDLPKPTHRHDIFEDYKAGRAKADDALVAQIERSRGVLTAFSIPYYEKEGFEADDLLGTITKECAEEKDLEIVIASGDMDTLQLVDGKRVQVFTLRRGMSDTILYDEAAVKERYGFGPEFLPDYKGLRGDPSDNIPGIPGIGEKTATTLILEFKTLEELYKTLEKDEAKVGELPGISARILGLLREHKEQAFFSKLLATIRTDAPIDFSVPENKWKDDFDLGAITTLFTDLGFRSLVDRVRGEFGAPTTHALFEDSKEEISKEELARLKVKAWLLDSDKTNPSEDEVRSIAGTNSLKEAEEVLDKKLEEVGMMKLYEEIEGPLIPVLEKMSAYGVKLDVAYLTHLSKKYHVSLEKIEHTIWDLAGEEFNINSPKQLREILFDKLDLGRSGIKKTSTGVRSTAESELEKLRDKHPIVKHIFEYRELQKLLSTYIDTLPRLVDEKSRLHAEFLQTGTTTGRFSSQNPNLQNIPIRSDLGRPIRNAFTAEGECLLLALDYSQIELRLAAWLSGDEKLIETFKEGKDIHARVATEVFGVPEDKVSPRERFAAKTINFGILYGMGVNALRANLGEGTTREDASTYLENYFTSFPQLGEYVERTKREARKKGYTETYFGRRRYFPALSSKLPHLRAQAERMAVNAPLQGTQADIIKRAMVEIDEYLEKEGLGNQVHLVLQVHDELVYEVEKEVVETAALQIKHIMESVIPLEETGGIVFQADAQIGENWGEMQKIT